MYRKISSLKKYIRNWRIRKDKMFRNNFVVSLKSEGKFFRENGDIIQLPFESEYSIYMKNLNSRKAVVKVSIDGKDVTDGHSLVIEPNSVLELEGFMDGNLAKNKFKFIKMTRQIENFRGTTPEDGLLVVEYDFEKEKPINREIVYIPYYLYPHYYPSYPYYYPCWTYTGTITYSGGGGTTTTISTANNANNVTYTSNYCLNANNIDNNGITVKGDDIQQQFYPTYIGEMENRPTVISLKMIGISKEEINNKPIFTNEKKICETCGTSNKNKNKFCSTCGTRLAD
jgi:hypothetical protein